MEGGRVCGWRCVDGGGWGVWVEKGGVWEVCKRGWDVWMEGVWDVCECVGGGG